MRALSKQGRAARTTAAIYKRGLRVWLAKAHSYRLLLRVDWKPHMYNGMVRIMTTMVMRVATAKTTSHKHHHRTKNRRQHHSQLNNATKQ